MYEPGLGGAATAGEPEQAELKGLRGFFERPGKAAPDLIEGLEGSGLVFEDDGGLGGHSMGEEKKPRKARNFTKSGLNRLGTYAREYAP
jgi:hypothetical protein